MADKKEAGHGGNRGPAPVCRFAKCDNRQDNSDDATAQSLRHIPDSRGVIVSWPDCLAAIRGRHLSALVRFRDNPGPTTRQTYERVRRAATRLHAWGAQP